MNLNIITKYSEFKNRTDWFGEYALIASIKIDGLKFLDDIERSKKELELNKSIITTNKSVQETNKLVRDISKVQRNLAYASFIVIAISTIFLILTYYKDDSPVQKSTYMLLQKQERLLDSMRKSQKGIDSSLKIMATKTSAKKN